MWVLFVTLLLLTCNDRVYSGDQEYSLPQFTELDNYDKCLSKKNSSYCFGKFDIISNSVKNKYFDFIKDYSEKPHNLDRTVFYRGYCVSSRCPQQANRTDGFEKCVQAWHPELNATLNSMYSCNTEKAIKVFDFPTWCYLSVVVTLLILNIVGTLLDRSSHAKKNKFWTSWSLRSNWKQLVEPFGDDSDTASLAPIQGIRVILLTVVIIIHVLVLYAGAFLQDPSYMEQVLSLSNRFGLFKMLSVVQVFYALSSFFATYNLLLNSKKQILDMGTMPKLILKRYFRIAPVHILTVGFAATLWPLITDGPLWSGKVYPDSDMCRKRIWYHVLHINNLVRPIQFCVPQSWSLATDIQFQIISLFLTIFLAKYYRDEIKIKTLALVFISSCLFNTGLAYIQNWKPLVYLVNGKSAANLFMDLGSFAPYYYVSPWGSMQSCLVGIIMGHQYFKWKKGGSKRIDNQWLNYLRNCTFPLLLLWMWAGQFTLHTESRLLMAVHLGLERPVFCGLACIWIYGLITGGKSSLKSFLSWRGWLPLGRLSLSVLMVHWLVILTNLSYDPQPVFLSHKNTIMDIVSVWSISYILAVPVTLLVELPAINTYNYLSTRPSKEKTN